VLLAIWLIGLGFAAVIGYVVWAHRRNHSARAAARNERLAQLVGEADPLAAAALRSAQAAAAPAPVAQKTAEPPPAATSEARELVTGYAARSRLFAPEHAVLYYILKTGLPEFEVLAHVSLSELVEAPADMQGWERERRRRALSSHIVHCAVVSKKLQVVAAVDIVPAGAHQPVFKMECLDAVGVRYLRVDPKRMPKRQEVRALILGGEG
jgi:hypothetical protein